jgi:hypothetical protein
MNLFEKGLNLVQRVWDAGKGLLNRACDIAVVEAPNAVVAVVGGGLAVVGAKLGLGVALATDTAPDASTIVDTATSTFDTVGGLVAAAVGFFIIVKIVKWIRK